jgi:hypothetical protein
VRRLQGSRITSSGAIALVIAFTIGACDAVATNPDGGEVTVPGLLSQMGSEPQVVVPDTAPAGVDMTVVVNTLPHTRSGHRICIWDRIETRTTVRGMDVEIRPVDTGRRLADDEECLWPDPDAVIEHVATFEAPAPGTMRVRVVGEEGLPDGSIRPLTVDRTVTVTPSDPIG